MSDDDSSPIALIGRFDPAEEALWLSALRDALPDEVVLPATAIRRPERVEVAVVANPEPAIVSRFTRLVWMQSLWAGVERLLAEPALASRPIVRMVDPELTRTMAEAVLAWALFLHRDGPAYRAQQAAARWLPRPYRRTIDRRIGILGAGELGVGAARVLVTAGFTVTTWSRSPRTIAGVHHLHGAPGLARVLATSDILVVLLPATPQTRGLLAADAIALLPPGAGLINVARGSIIITADLIDALDRGHLSHAVLDVFDQEPLRADSPLWRHPAVTVLPHVAADSDPTTAARIAAANIRHWRTRGVIPPAVDPVRGY